MSFVKILLITPLALLVLYMLFYYIGIFVFKVKEDSKTIFSGSCMFAIIVWLAIVGLII